MAAILVFVILVGTGAVLAQQPPPPPPSAPEEEPEQVAEPEPAPAPEVKTASEIKRAMFTTSIVDREPSDQIDTLNTPAEKVIFFTEIVGMEGKTITHKWTYKGEVKAEVSFDIGGVRWRVYSSKTLIPAWVGTWKVTVVDGEGNTLHEARLVYKDPE